jgi:hypothetical protein
VFLDEGCGKYNPAPQILDEAVCNEWPGREVGVFISIGTGKRPEGTNQQQHLWWEGFVSGGMGDFAEARRKLVSKIEDCEKTHQAMKDNLAKRQVNPENYYRLNVSVGVGEFGMNEWNRLAEISTNTRMYLSETNVQSSNLDAASKLARIHRAKQRWERAEKGHGTTPLVNPWEPPERPLPNVPEPTNFAVELPAEDVVSQPYRQQDPDLLSAHYGRASDYDKYVVVSDEYPQPVTSDIPPRHSGEYNSKRRSGDQFTHGAVNSISSVNSSPQIGDGEWRRQSPPPLPPKTPLQGEKPGHHHSLSGSHNLPHVNTSPARPPPGGPLPYPDTDGPPPVVNKARKPEYTR